MRASLLAAVACGLAILPAAAPAKEAHSATAEKPSTAKALDPAAKAAGLRLAEFIYEDESQVQAVTRSIETSLGPAFRSNSDFQSLEREYAGFIDAVLAEMRPVMARYARLILPEYRERVAEIYATHLTAAEIDDLHGFYRTPTGRKVIKGMVDDRSMDAVISEALAEPDKPASYSAVTKDYRSTVTAMNNLLDKSDDPTLIAMGRKPYVLRALKIGPEIRKLDVEMMNRPTPEFEQALEDAFAKVIARFEATASAKPE